MSNNILVQKSPSSSVSQLRKSQALRPNRNLFRTLGKRAAILLFAAYLPLCATITGCDDSFKEKREKIVQTIPSRSLFGPKLVSLGKEFRNLGYFEPYVIGEARGYKTGDILILCSPDITETAYDKNIAYKRISISDLKSNQEYYPKNNTLEYYWLWGVIRALRYENSFFDPERVNSITAILDKLGFGYSLFVREGWYSELAFVLPGNILISLKSNYRPKEIAVKYFDQNKKSINRGELVEKIEKVGIFAIMMFYAQEGIEGVFSNPLELLSVFLIYQSAQLIEDKIDKTNASKHAKDKPTSEELLELEKYSLLILPELKDTYGSKPLFQDNLIYPHAVSGLNAVYLLGRLPGKVTYTLAREEVLHENGAILGTPLCEFSKDGFEFVKNKLEENGIGYDLMFLTVTTPHSYPVCSIVFVLNTPSKVVVALGYYHHLSSSNFRP